MKVNEVVFTGERCVEVLEKELLEYLKDDEVLLKAVVSGISSGTELLVYRNQMPDSISVDSEFAHSQSKFSYPLSYGYSMVAKIIQLGSSVSNYFPKLEIGSHVFVFHPHVSHFITKAENVIPLPEYIQPLDAIFLPNMETAVSLVHDAHPRIGEDVAIIGQGIVGLLTAAALKNAMPSVRSIAVDTNSERLHMSSQFAKVDVTMDVSTIQRPFAEISQNLDSNAETLKRRAVQHNLRQLTAHQLGIKDGECWKGADVSIEVSSVGAGLENAVEITADGGTLVIGSWYGTKEISVRNLGGRFHRSHMKLIASQVSSLPPKLSLRWTKSRRMELAWNLLNELNPSQYLISHTMNVQQAKSAYELLDNGSALQIAFTYSDS